MTPRRLTVSAFLAVMAIAVGVSLAQQFQRFQRPSAIDDRHDSRGSGRRAELESGRKVQGRCLYFCPH